MTRYHIPSVASSPKLERRCPHCHRSAGRIHSRITRRRISDPKVETTAQRRMKCPFCKTSWTIVPNSVAAYFGLKTLWFGESEKHNKLGIVKISTIVGTVAVTPKS